MLQIKSSEQSDETAYFNRNTISSKDLCVCVAVRPSPFATQPKMTTPCKEYANMTHNIFQRSTKTAQHIHQFHSCRRRWNSSDAEEMREREREAKNVKKMKKGAQRVNNGLCNQVPTINFQPGSDTLLERKIHTQRNIWNVGFLSALIPLLL